MEVAYYSKQDMKARNIIKQKGIINFIKNAMSAVPHHVTPTIRRERINTSSISTAPHVYSVEEDTKRQDTHLNHQSQNDSQNHTVNTNKKKTNTYTHTTINYK